MSLDAGENEYGCMCGLSESVCLRSMIQNSFPVIIIPTFDLTGLAEAEEVTNNYKISLSWFAGFEALSES